MKKLLTLLIAGAFIMPVFAAEDKKPETKKVCVDVQGKDSKSLVNT